MLSDSSITQVVQPLLRQVFDQTRPDLISIGFLLSLWSGSRALYIFIDTITVMYGLDGKRGIVKTRLMSLGLYLGALVIGSLVLPLLMAGPELVTNAVPESGGLINAAYWPFAILLLIVSLTTLYHLAVPVSTPWREDIPGALVALVVLVFCSVALRLYLVSSIEGHSVYGSLAAPVAVLLWIFVVALAVLIGAAMNAAIDRRWPTLETADARAENERAHEEAAAAVVREVAARRAVERARRARELGSPRAARRSTGRRTARTPTCPPSTPSAGPTCSRPTTSAAGSPRAAAVRTTGRPRRRRTATGPPRRRPSTRCRAARRARRGTGAEPGGVRNRRWRTERRVKNRLAGSVRPASVLSVRFGRRGAPSEERKQEVSLVATIAMTAALGSNRVHLSLPAAG